VPLYDAFDSDASDNSEPYDAIVPSVDRNERNPADGPDARFSSELPLTLTDRVPQQLLDRILWHYVHGSGSQPPPPGPNSSGLDLQKWRHSEAADLAEGIAEVREELLGPYEDKYGAAALGETGESDEADEADSGE